MKEHMRNLYKEHRRNIKEGLTFEIGGGIPPKLKRSQQTILSQKTLSKIRDIARRKGGNSS